QRRDDGAAAAQQAVVHVRCHAGSLPTAGRRSPPPIVNGAATVPSQPGPNGSGGFRVAPGKQAHTGGGRVVPSADSSVRYSPGAIAEGTGRTCRGVGAPTAGHHRTQRGQEPRHVASERWGPLHHAAAAGGCLERPAALPAGGTAVRGTAARGTAARELAVRALAVRSAAGVRAGPAGFLGRAGPVLPGSAPGIPCSAGRWQRRRGPEER